MTNWHDLTQTAPELTAMVERRFRTTGLGYLATLRRDGAPRISGVEPLFAHGEVWLGMMPASRKGDDLRRDPRCCLHAANIDKQVADGDARIAGRAVQVHDDETVERFLVAFAAEAGKPVEEAVPPGPFDLFRLDVDELVHLKPGGDHLVIESWTTARGAQRVERR